MTPEDAGKGKKKILLPAAAAVFAAFTAALALLFLPGGGGAETAPPGIEKPKVVDPGDPASYIADGAALLAHEPVPGREALIAFAPLSVLGVNAALAVRYPENGGKILAAQASAYDRLLAKYDMGLEKAVIGAMFDAWNDGGGEPGAPPFVYEGELAKSVVPPAVILVGDRERDGLADIGLLFYVRHGGMRAFRVGLHQEEILGVEIHKTQGQP